MNRRDSVAGLISYIAPTIFSLQVISFHSIGKTHEKSCCVVHTVWDKIPDVIWKPEHFQEPYDLKGRE